MRVQGQVPAQVGQQLGVTEAFYNLMGAVGSALSSTQSVQQQAPQPQQQAPLPQQQAPQPQQQQLPQQPAPQQQVNAPKIAVVEEKKIEFPSEIQRIYYHFVNGAAWFTDEYPFTSVWVAVGAAFLGLFNVLSLSPTSILTGVFFFTICTVIVKNIAREGIGSFLFRLPSAIFQIGSKANTKVKTEEPTKVNTAEYNIE